MRADPPRKPHMWLAFAFFVYWPTMAALMLGLVVVDGEALRPAMTAIAAISAVVLAAGFAWLLRLTRGTAPRPAPQLPSPSGH